MKRIRFVLLMVLIFACLIQTACASDPPQLADEHLVSTLLPGYTMKRGVMCGEDMMRLLMYRPDGKLVFVGAQRADGTWRLTESTPLPEGTILGVENFTQSIGLPNPKGEGYPYYAVSLSPVADTWGVSLLYPPDDGQMKFEMGRNWISTDYPEKKAVLGDHPWSDVTVIDWTALPASYEDAAAQIDRRNWAVVCNPDPNDRLHLRSAPDCDAPSDGKYYNRTLVRVLEQGETWCHVRIGATEGWMMTDYLVFGAAMDEVASAGPGKMYPVREGVPLYRHFLDEKPSWTLEEAEEPHVIGVLGEEWYHIWVPSEDEYAYVRQSDLWTGNG